MKSANFNQALHPNRRRARAAMLGESGQGLVEYALILALVAICVIATLTLLSPTITKFLENLPNLVRNATPQQKTIAGVVVLIVLGLWIARLAPQFAKVLSTDVREIEVARPAYERIESQIDSILLQKGVVRQQDLDVPSGTWSLAIPKYLDKQKHFRIIYNEKRRSLTFANSAEVNAFNGLWQEAVSPIADPNALDSALAVIAEKLGCKMIAIANGLFDGKADLRILNLPHWDTPIPSQIPVIIWLAENPPQGQEMEQLRHLLGGHNVTHPIAILIDLFPDSPVRTEVLLETIKKIQQVFAYDLVPLGHDDFARIIAARESREMFTYLLLPYVDLISISPFILTGPASESMFFGREKELREITEHAKLANYILLGGRRVGKTSIIKRLERIRLPAVGFHALYHDCSFTPTQSELIQAIANDRIWFPESPVKTLVSFSDIIQALPAEKPLIILLDEADRLIEPDRQAGYPLFNTFRAMANADRCRFVLSGEQTLRTELRNPNSPLYNFGNELLIGRLELQAVEELITHPLRQLQIELENRYQIVQRIWSFTSGHPNVVQRLCQRLIVRLNQRGNRRLTLSDVEAVVADPDFLRKDFLNVYWERASSLERLCTLEMAADEQMRTLAAIHAALISHDLNVTLNQVDDALERLVDLRNILSRTTSGYEFAVSAFPEVISKTARLDDLIALNCETVQRHGDVVPYLERG